jgi:hypothetical protein
VSATSRTLPTPRPARLLPSLRRTSEEFAWIIAKAGKFNFATEMLDSLNKYGSLTERQLATVTRLMLQDRERDAQRATAKAEAEANAVEVDITPIMKAMETAMANDIKRPLLRAGEFKFAYKPGVIYVRNRSGDVYYGKIVDGRFFASRDCTADMQARSSRSPAIRCRQRSPTVAAPALAPSVAAS